MTSMPLPLAHRDIRYLLKTKKGPVVKARGTQCAWAYPRLAAGVVHRPRPNQAVGPVGDGRGRPAYDVRFALVCAEVPPERRVLAPFVHKARGQAPRLRWRGACVRLNTPEGPCHGISDLAHGRHITMTTEYRITATSMGALCRRYQPSCNVASP
jgi:hypothetical protein